ncbi:MAG: hypothetical protein MZV65_46830 [Chromatiales bacterium]|nr:hypothetical protein [Chromatiales bacterium]
MAFVFVQTAPPHEVAVIPMERQQLQAGREQWQAALARFDQVLDGERMAGSRTRRLGR